MIHLIFVALLLILFSFTFLGGIFVLALYVLYLLAKMFGAAKGAAEEKANAFFTGLNDIFEGNVDEEYASKDWNHTEEYKSTKATAIVTGVIFAICSAIVISAIDFNNEIAALLNTTVENFPDWFEWAFWGVFVVGSICLIGALSSVKEAVFHYKNMPKIEKK